MEVLKRIGQETGQQVSDKGETKSASLKDLCPEDKRRIANLIKELARVSEEKEVTEERLKAEQEAFEKKIRQLEDQNELIVKEREALQRQYRECQELLSLYQKYLSEQQEKLTHSLSRLEAAKQVEEEQQMSHQRGPCQLVAPSDVDGSYLGVARLQTMYRNHNLTRRSPSHQPSTRLSRNRGLLADGTQEGQTEIRNSGRLENGLQDKRSNVASPATPPFLSPHLRRTPDGEKRKTGCPIQGCPFHSKVANPAHESSPDACHLRGRYPGPPCESSSEYFDSPPFARAKAGEGLRSKGADRGQIVSEEKRKQLLLQKMELEIEKERLQDLLAEQEAKLLQQQEQLQKSRRDYHRFKGHAANSEDGLMRPGSLAPALNGICDGLSSPRLDCEDCPFRTPSRRSGRAPQGNDRIGLGTKAVGFDSDADGPIFPDSTKKEHVRTKRGTPGRGPATSPGSTATKKELVTAATSPIQQGAWRYETSLLDLVAAMSPRQDPPHGPPSRACEKPPWRRRSPRAKNGLAELEESRILEEIFFI